MARFDTGRLTARRHRAHHRLRDPVRGQVSGPDRRERDARHEETDGEVSLAVCSTFSRGRSRAAKVFDQPGTLVNANPTKVEIPRSARLVGYPCHATVQAGQVNDRGGRRGEELAPDPDDDPGPAVESPPKDGSGEPQPRSATWCRSPRAPRRPSPRPAATQSASRRAPRSRRPPARPPRPGTARADAPRPPRA